MKFGIKRKLVSLLTSVAFLGSIFLVYAQGEQVADGEKQTIDVILEDISAKQEALPILSGEAKIKISISGLKNDANIAQLALDFSGNMEYKAVQWLIEKASDVIGSLRVIPDGDILYLSAVFNERVIKGKGDAPTDICILTFRGEPGDSLFLSLIDDIDESYIEENSNAMIPTLVVNTVLAEEQTYTVRIEGPGFVPYEKAGISFEKELKVENDEFIPGELDEKVINLGPMTKSFSHSEEQSDSKNLRILRGFKTLRLRSG